MYPNQGVVRVEGIRVIESGAADVRFYVLRVEATGSVIMVPVETAASLGVRPPIGATDCERLLALLAAAFSPPSTNWKERNRQFAERTRLGDLFEIADVVKQLAYLDANRSLGFADKRLLERGRALIVCEAALAGRRTEAETADLVDRAVASACRDHAVGRTAGGGSAASCAKTLAS